MPKQFWLRLFIISIMVLLAFAGSAFLITFTVR